MSCWRYTPSPKQDRFQDFLEAICPDFQIRLTVSSFNSQANQSNQHSIQRETLSGEGGQ